MVHDLQLPQICDRIKGFAETDRFDGDTRSAILCALALFDVNRMNRNQLTHFLPTGSRSGMEFWRNKGPSFDMDVIPSDVGTIRRVADEIRTAQAYQVNLANRLSARRENFFAKPEPLPEKPPLPERIWKPQGQQKKQGRAIP